VLFFLVKGSVFTGPAVKPFSQNYFTQAERHKEMTIQKRELKSLELSAPFCGTCAKQLVISRSMHVV
jgi:hypothetical protein